MDKRLIDGRVWMLITAVGLPAFAFGALANCSGNGGTGGGGGGTSTGTGGSTNSGTTSTTDTGTGGTGVGGSGAMGGMGGYNTGGAGGAECATCAMYLADPESPDLCLGSEDVYATLATCVCTGACAEICGNNACAGQPASDACVTCIQDTVEGCGDEFNDCANDL